MGLPLQRGGKWSIKW
ncbi:hypothetical protein FQN60_010559 [Etheostoma spectabile]|uniref:Uncharacterized protein n=1 Tax=Etheostoma spectabile TaxID=54343 RepID=A0A5J5CCN8_9PERO|nr:hypothetical protein FQN60_010559 [Etheostoma spectabile]